MSYENFVLDGVLYKNVNEAAKKLNYSKSAILKALRANKTSMEGIKKRNSYLTVNGIIYTRIKIEELAKKYNVTTNAIRYHLRKYGNFKYLESKVGPHKGKYHNKIINNWLLENTGKKVGNTSSIRYKGTHQITGRVTYGEARDFIIGKIKEKTPKMSLSNLIDKLDKLKARAEYAGFIVEYTVTKKEEYRKRYVHPVLDKIMNPEVSLKDRMSKEEILKLSVEEIDFSKYEMKALYALDCKTMEDVAKLTKEDILSVPHCGLKTVALIKSRLYDMGLI